MVFSFTNTKLLTNIFCCTINVNIAGLPGISVPCGVGADGMPIGMQMIGPKFSEATLLRTAANYEKICGGFGSVADLD